MMKYKWHIHKLLKISFYFSEMAIRLTL